MAPWVSSGVSGAIGDIIVDAREFASTLTNPVREKAVSPGFQEVLKKPFDLSLFPGLPGTHNNLVSK